MFNNHKMLAHISSKIHKVSENTLDGILYRYLDDMKTIFKKDDGTKKLSEFKPEFDVLNKYHYAK